MALLEVRNLKVNYGPIQAIRGIDLDVEEGQIVALLGAIGTILIARYLQERL